MNRELLRRVEEIKATEARAAQRTADRKKAKAGAGEAVDAVRRRKPNARGGLDDQLRQPMDAEGVKFKMRGRTKAGLAATVVLPPAAAAHHHRRKEKTVAAKSLHDYAGIRQDLFAKNTGDHVTRLLRAAAAGSEALTRSPEELARARRSQRARLAIYGTGGLAAAGGTFGLANSVGNRVGPARKVKLVNMPEKKKEPASKGYYVIPPGHTSRGGEVGRRVLRATGKKAGQDPQARMMAQFERDFPASGSQPAVSHRRQMAQADRDFPKTGTSKAFSTRDQDSFTSPVPTTMRPAGKGPGKTGVVHGRIRSGMERRSKMPSFATRDQNSSVGTTKLVARTPSGRFVSHENDLKVVHVSTSRQKDNTLQRFTGVGKSFLGDNGAKVGRRIPVEKAFGMNGLKQSKTLTRAMKTKPEIRTGFDSHRIAAAAGQPTKFSAGEHTSRSLTDATGYGQAKMNDMAARRGGPLLQRYRTMNRGVSGR